MNTTKNTDGGNPLDAYVPSSLTREQWRLARPVVLAAIASIPDLPVKQHKPYASRLCRFLALGNWDQTSRPDLCVLLTEKAIHILVAAGIGGVEGASRGTYQRVLRRIGRHVGAIPVRPAPVQRTPSDAARAFWLAAAAAPVPFTHIAAALRLTGRTVHGGMWTGFVDDILRVNGSSRDSLADLLAPRSVACAETDPTGTVLDVRRAARDLRSAGNIDLRVVIPIAPSPSAQPTNPGASPRRPVSPTAQAKLARAAVKRAKGAATPPAAIAQEDLPPLNEDIDVAIISYRSGLVDDATWAVIGPVVAHALRAYQPPNVRWVGQQAGNVTSFVAWVQRRNHATAKAGASLSADDLMVPGLVDQFVDGELAHRPDASRATARSTLRRVVRNLNPDDVERIGYVPIQAPYTPAECATFVRLARNQPTPDLRRALSACVALGLGAGLDGRDQREVTPADITETDLGDGVTGLVVKVRGPRPRTVAMRGEYEPLLREALALHNKSRRGKNTPLYGLSKGRKNVTSTVTSKAVTATGTGVDISAARLRSTWLLACMNAPVPLAVLLAAAGLRTARSLTDLLAYCPPASPADIAVALAAVKTPGSGGEQR